MFASRMWKIQFYVISVCRCLCLVFEFEIEIGARGSVTKSRAPVYFYIVL